MQRPMRSKLFVPGSRPELFAKAAASAADALSFDLEDAVAKNRKAEARSAVGDFLRGRPTDDGKVVVVRSNGLSSGLFEDDLKVVVGPGLAEIATADPRVVGLQIGYADLFEPCGINRSDPNALSYVRMAIRLAAAEAKVPAYDGAYAVVAKPERYREECEEARNLGFAGKSCIHPTQVPIANECFMPRPAEIEKAQRILAAAEDAAAKGVGAFVVDGQMIDEPFLASARAVVALAEQLDPAAAGDGR
jgi:citrate lyase subunit beta/citryl-CoA lyase